MVLSELCCLPSDLQELVITATCLYIQHKISQRIFISVLNDITVEKDVEVSLERLVEYFILHSNNVAALDKELSLSLICTEKLRELIVRELGGLEGKIQPRGSLVDSEFIVGVDSDKAPFVKMELCLSDGKGGHKNHKFNMSLQTFHSLEQSSNEIKSVCSP